MRLRGIDPIVRIDPIVLIVLALEVVIAVMNRMYHIQVIHLLQQAIIAIVQAM